MLGPGNDEPGGERLTETRESKTGEREGEREGRPERRDYYYFTINS